MLPKPDDPSVAQIPDVRDLRVDRRAGRLRRALVARLDQHGVARGDDAPDVDAEAVEVLRDAGDDAGQHGLRPMNGPPASR